MNTITAPTLPAIGTPMPGGFFAGAYLLNGQRRALITSPKKLGELNDSVWIKDYQNVPSAQSLNDGLANTKAMAEAGSDIAKQALAAVIDGLNDFYIPSQDELEIIYRAFKPTTETNSLWGRSGVNASAETPTHPYSEQVPAQTLLDAFKEGGEEALEAKAYWSSTQHAGSSYNAWSQNFRNGYQDYDNKSVELGVRLVRSQPI